MNASIVSECGGSDTEGSPILGHMHSGTGIQGKKNSAYLIPDAKSGPKFQCSPRGETYGRV